MIEKHVAASIIWIPNEEHGGIYVVHKRTKGIDNSETDKLDLYGGEIEAEDESYAHTASRELKEKSGVLFEPQIFRPASSFHVKSERGGETILTEAEIFLLQTSYGVKPELFNHGVPMTERQVSRAKALGELTSVASVALSKVKGI